MEFGHKRVGVRVNAHKQVIKCSYGKKGKEKYEKVIHSIKFKRKIYLSFK